MKPHTNGKCAKTYRIVPASDIVRQCRQVDGDQCLNSIQKAFNMKRRIQSIIAKPNCIHLPRRKCSRCVAIIHRMQRTELEVMRLLLRMGPVVMKPNILTCPMNELSSQALFVLKRLVKAANNKNGLPATTLVKYMHQVRNVELMTGTATCQLQGAGGIVKQELIRPKIYMTMRLTLLPAEEIDLYTVVLPERCRTMIPKDACVIVKRDPVLLKIHGFLNVKFHGIEAIGMHPAYFESIHADIDGDTLVVNIVEGEQCSMEVKKNLRPENTMYQHFGRTSIHVSQDRAMKIHVMRTSGSLFYDSFRPMEAREAYRICEQAFPLATTHSLLKHVLTILATIYPPMIAMTYLKSIDDIVDRQLIGFWGTGKNIWDYGIRSMQESGVGCASREVYGNADTLPLYPNEEVLKVQEFRKTYMKSAINIRHTGYLYTQLLQILSFVVVSECGRFVVFEKEDAGTIILDKIDNYFPHWNILQDCVVEYIYAQKRSQTVDPLSSSD